MNICKHSICLNVNNIKFIQNCNFNILRSILMSMYICVFVFMCGYVDERAGAIQTPGIGFP